MIQTVSDPSKILL